MWSWRSSRWVPGIRCAQPGLLAGGEALHQRPDAESPRRDLVGMLDAVDQCAQLGGGDGDDVADDVREALPRRKPVLGRREHRAEIQDEAVGILVIRADRVLNEIERIAADLAHRACALE